jgi:RNA 2',3'-cyclic 3'-phosphodiesterase
VIRAFIAIEFASATVNRISTAIEQLKPHNVGIRWVAPANYHLTLKFLGNIDESQIETVGHALANALHPFQRFTINAKGLGVFPSVKRPRVLWVGLVGSPLTTLAVAVEAALAPLGFPREEKAFTPHLTIGRWRQTDRADRVLEEELKSWTHFEFGATGVDEVILFESVLKPAGAIYNRLKVVTLKPDRVT